MLAERVRAQVDGLAASGLDVDTFTATAFDVLRRAVPFVAGCVGSADPATGLITGTVKYGVLTHETDDEWAHYEYEVDDPTAFLRVARLPGGVLALGEAGSGLVGRSPRFQDFLRPVWGFDDEVRLALRAEDSTWGFMALFREGNGGFTAADQAFLSSVAPSLATGLRAGLLVTAAGRATEVDGPAVVVVDAAGEVVSASLGAEARVADLGGGPLGRSALPMALLTLVRAARRATVEGRPALPRMRLRTASGSWVVAHASPLLGRDGTGTDVVVTIEDARPPEIIPLVVAAFGLTPRERDVVALVLQGVDTTAIGRALHLSAYTVQDHLKSVFDKAGVRSRRELTARVYHDQYAPRLAAGSDVAASGWFATAAGTAVAH
ncbi:response regulator transcription factor [Blastococcus sp. TF02A-26]|uniref:response regulator transcription factor n=1 Tax=Blastococcus sp. TF02A-26 TaxID=2250577 RepID=UPI000DE9E42D|nr:LuxR C-terminal-related transcriptional regulator [Blastococcus sp. TF02A-26]RBY90893.1 LuxR family transcriptional regulator [Blastococcus sp. TF02A-26]